MQLLPYSAIRFMLRRTEAPHREPCQPLVGSVAAKFSDWEPPFKPEGARLSGGAFSEGDLK
jgi:hypothetical protein